MSAPYKWFMRTEAVDYPTTMVLTHIVFTSIPAWGHTRPLCILAARLVKENKNVVVSLVQAPMLYDKAQAEISAELWDDDHAAETRDRIRVISAFDMKSNSDIHDIMQRTALAYSAACETLLAGSAITCASTGTVFDAVPLPSLFIIDFVASGQFQVTKAMVGDRVPIIISIAGHAASMIGIFGPEALGGPGDLTSKSEAEAARLGITYEEFGDRLYRETKGAVVKLPGVPEMFDYEMFPQQLPWKDLRSQVLRDVYKCLKSSNGVILASSHAWEGEAIDAMRSWFSDWGKVAYPLGPLLPSNFGSSILEDSREEETKYFLDSMLAQFGENSTILISLGSVYWPTDTEYLEEIINALIEKNFPFILSHASPFAKISQDLGEKIKSSGHGLLTSWCPQQMVLNHSATGWFLTHCGHSSVTEALASGIPMIAWPFEADQPATASQLESLNLAIELLEVRNSEHALKPLRRNGRGAKGTRQAVGVEIRNVIDACRGAQGKELRKNAMAMKEKLNTACKGSGPARGSFNEFVNTYVSQ